MALTMEPKRTSLGYEVEMVGTNLPLRIARGNNLEMFIKNKLLPEIGNIIRRNIVRNISNFNFKRSQGKMAGAVRVKVLANEMAVVVYNDNTEAPHARFQEFGVRRHPMRYLLNKKNPNVIPYRIFEGRFVFAGRGSKYYGKPGNHFATVTPNSFAKGKWIHPGYPGKFLYRQGMLDAMNQIKEKFKWFTYRVVDNAGGGVTNATA